MSIKGKLKKIFHIKEEQKLPQYQNQTTEKYVMETPPNTPQHKSMEELEHTTRKSLELAKQFLNNDFQFNDINFGNQNGFLSGYLDQNTLGMIGELSNSALGNSVDGITCF